MNSGSKVFAAASLVVLYAVSAAYCAETIDYGKCNPPWKPGKEYSVRSQYEMTLDGVVMDIKKIRKAWDGWIFHHDEKVKGHYKSKPFSGKYACYLNYQTFGAEFVNKNNGSVFRQYRSADVSFQPLNEYGKTVIQDAEPGWWRRFWGLDPRSKEIPNREIADKMQDADFMFREIFMTDGKHLDTLSWYFLVWNQRSAFAGDRTHHMNVFKKAARKAGGDGLLSSELQDISPKDRARIEGQTVGSGLGDNWSRMTDIDLGYNVAQAEAKMMTYAIYGQEKTRNVGDVWEIDAETLESFFPLQSKDRKPFSFTGGVLVLTVVSDDDGIVTIKSLPRGKVDGSMKSTDLRIQPLTEQSAHRPSFNIYMENERENFVRFTIDSFNEVCTKAEMKATLRNYSGDVPKVEQFSLDDPDHRYEAHIDSGTVSLHCMITTAIDTK